MIDYELWARVQQIVYPHRCPSPHEPFAADQCSPRTKPASWLYHQLVNDADLRNKVLG